MAFALRNKLGIWGERTAESEYLKRGYVLVARNVYNTRGKRLGEVDLIVRNDTHIIFVEVKTRGSNKYGLAVESISATKKQRLIKAVFWFLRRYPSYNKLHPRIDVCAIDIPSRVQSSSLDKQRINVRIITSAVTLDY